MSLVAELRDMADAYEPYSYKCLLAADEIERLTAERERLERARDDARQAAWRHTIEITRLRALLEKNGIKNPDGE